MVTDYRRKHIFESPISLKPEKIIKDSSVRVFIFPNRHKHVPHQWREKIEWDCHIHERRWSTHVPFAPFFFFYTFWFHYHFFPGFSTIHLSFMEMVKRHKNFESYFLRHYVSSNHFFLCFFPFSDCKKRNVSYLFSRGIRQTDRCSTRQLASILSKRIFLP